MSIGLSIIALFITIALQRIAECMLERFEPGLEMLPLIESLTIDGLADLLGTGGANAAHRLVKLDALGFERQAAEIKNAPHVALQIIDDILMIDAKHPSGQYFIPMSHQLEVGSVVTRDILDAVGELLALGEQLFQIAETARDGFAPCVDDLGPRQHQVNQAQVPKVVRHLVDEVRLAGTVDPGGVEILLAELPEFLERHLGKDARVARIIQIRVAALKIADDLLDVGKFLRALDLRVRSQDLFEQRRTRARQADDKYGVRVRYAAATAAGEKFGCADLDLVAGIVLDDFRAIPAFGALERITQLVIMEGFGKFTVIFQRLSECKMKMIAIGDPDRRLGLKGR